MAKLIKNWVIALVILFVFDFLWHGLILGSFYTSSMVDFARSNGGKLTGLIQYMILADIMASLGYTYFVLMNPINKKYIQNGIIFGIVIIGFYAFSNVALLAGWNITLALADIAYGLIAGIILGFVAKFLNRAPASDKNY